MAAIGVKGSVRPVLSRLALRSPAWAPTTVQTEPHACPAAAAEAGEHVWALAKAGRRFDCELRFHGESYDWEVQLLEDGEIRYGRRFPLRAGATPRLRPNGRAFCGTVGPNRHLTMALLT